MTEEELREKRREYQRAYRRRLRARQQALEDLEDAEKSQVRTFMVCSIHAITGKWQQYSITLSKLGEDVSEGEIAIAKAFFRVNMSRWLIGVE